MEVNIRGKIQPDNSAGILYVGFGRDKKKLIDSGIPNGAEVDVQIDGRLNLRGYLRLKGGTPWLGPIGRGDRVRMTKSIRRARLPVDQFLPVVIRYQSGDEENTANQDDLASRAKPEYERWICDAPSLNSVPKREDQDRASEPPNLDQQLEAAEGDKELGDSGEQWIMKVEIERLHAAQRGDLAARVEHVAVTRGSKEGYDILSFDEIAGGEIYIEVKTTRSNSSQPFFLTANELKVACTNPKLYYLYRVFDFDDEKQCGPFFVLSQPDLSKLSMEAVVFRVSFRT